MKKYTAYKTYGQALAAIMAGFWLSMFGGSALNVGIRRSLLIGLEEGIPWWLLTGLNPANIIAAYQPIGAASLAASYINLANPGTYDAAPGVAPGWDAVNGWIGDGATKYLRTGYIPGALLSGSAIVRFSNAAFIATRTIFGSYSAANNGYRINHQTAATIRYSNSNQLLDIGPYVANGTLAFAGNKAYANGIDTGGVNPAIGGSPGIEVYILALNLLGAAVNFHNCNIQAILIVSTVLTAPQVLEGHTRMMALP